MMNAPMTDEKQHLQKDTQKLMTHGTIFLPQSQRWVEVKRGMLVRGAEGLVAGQVAAIVVDVRRQQVTHFLLTRLSSGLDYRMVSLDLIVDVPMATLLLSINNAAIMQLPRWPAPGGSVASDKKEC